MKCFTFLSFLALAFPFASANPARRHHEIAHRARTDDDVHKRSFTNARFTYFDDGLGACGEWNGPTDHIVALNSYQFGSGYPGPNCFKNITITYNGMTTNATITDRCEICPEDGLDFSRGLFDFFASETIGVLYGTWWFI